MIDKDEYPQTAEIENGAAWPSSPTCGTPRTRRRHRLLDHRLQRGVHARRDGPQAALAAAHRRTIRGGRPNLVMGANVQVCWEKFCTYWEVEPRLVPMEGDRFHLDAAEAVALLRREHDRRRRGPRLDLRRQLRAGRRHRRGAGRPGRRAAGPDVPMHVDGASGGMIAPFLDPDLVWDFRLPRVASINTSGHKYGLVYPGVGWAIWRDAAALPEELVFKVNYLGGEMPTFALNFSRPGAAGRRPVLHLPAARLRRHAGGAAGQPRRRHRPGHQDRRDRPSTG